jgi:hypothetical protein
MGGAKKQTLINSNCPVVIYEPHPCIFVVQETIQFICSGGSTPVPWTENIASVPRAGAQSSQ